MPLVNGRFVADMKSPRTPDNEEPAAERACDFRPVDKGFTEEMALAEAERCLNCKKPFCVEGCPVNINIPRFIEQIRAKDFGGALDTIREDSMLPAICGRVCPQENHHRALRLAHGRGKHTRQFIERTQSDTDIDAAVLEIDQLTANHSSPRSKSISAQR